jgi:SAM-dependent methyltransferase
MDNQLQMNREHWNELVAIHAESEFYRLADFKAGQSSLLSVETHELGDVRGKSLLHLQCHFGMDTLSWARRGARVTGADFSENAIALAHSLSAELDIPAEFVCSNIYELPDVLSGQFDIVFTSYGILCWLPDLKRWAQVIAHFLKPGGTFYIVEQHPLCNIFDDDERKTGVRIAYSYFYLPEPYRWQDDGSYADPGAHVEQPVTYEWQHSLSDILNALIAAGLRIEFLHEFPFCMFRKFACMQQGADGWWRPAGYGDMLPMLFSLQAVKPPESHA